MGSTSGSGWLIIIKGSSKSWWFRKSFFCSFVETLLLTFLAQNLKTYRLTKFIIKVPNTWNHKSSRSTIPTSFPELILPGQAALAVMEKKVLFWSVFIKSVGHVFSINLILFVFFYFLKTVWLNIGGPVEGSMWGCSLLGKAFTFLKFQAKKWCQSDTNTEQSQPTDQPFPIKIYFLQFPQPFPLENSHKYSTSIKSFLCVEDFVFIGPDSDHWECLSVTHSLPP